MGHMSSLVRSVAHACMSECAYPCRQQQPQHLQQRMWQLVQTACGSDEAAAVRAAAAKCLGYLAEGPLVTNATQGYRCHFTVVCTIDCCQGDHRAAPSILNLMPVASMSDHDRHVSRHVLLHNTHASLVSGKPSGKLMTSAHFLCKDV